MGTSTVNNDVQCGDGCYDIIGKILVASGEIKTIDTDGKVKIDNVVVDKTKWKVYSYGKKWKNKFQMKAYSKLSTWRFENFKVKICNKNIIISYISYWRNQLIGQKSTFNKWIDHMCKTSKPSWSYSH